jgi:hypothetical protein
MRGLLLGKVRISNNDKLSTYLFLGTNCMHEPFCPPWKNVIAYLLTATQSPTNSSHTIFFVRIHDVGVHVSTAMNKEDTV